MYLGIKNQISVISILLIQLPYDKNYSHKQIGIG
jgi:hypothetical protein